jgi:SNF2 family DNA or RNA helicase
MGIRLGKNITQYRDTYFNPGIMMNGYPVTWYPKWGAEEQIYNRISDIVISMKNKYITLPQLTFNPVYVDMDDDEYKVYKDMMVSNVLEIDDDTVITAANAAVLAAKLSQMASGAIYTDAKAHQYIKIHEHKLEICEYIINNTPGSVLIAYHYQSDKDMLLRYLTEHDLNPVIFDGSPEMERDWNQKKIPIMLLQPASCGFGVNLQVGGSTLIWYTLPWSLEEYEQTNARIYRQGQQNPVVIHQLMTKRTIDTKILKALEAKNLSQQKLISAVEATLQCQD